MTTDLHIEQERGDNTELVDYSPDLVPKPRTTIVVRELSMLSHDGLGGLSIAGNLLSAQARIYLAEYDMLLEPDDQFAIIKLAGPCLSVMILRDAEDRKNKRGRYSP